MISSIVKPSDFLCVGNWDRVVFCDKSRTGIGILGILVVNIDCVIADDVTVISSVVCDGDDGDVICCIWVAVVVADVEWICMWVLRLAR